MQVEIHKLNDNTTMPLIKTINKEVNNCSQCKFWIRAAHNDHLSELFGCCHRYPPLIAPLLPKEIDPDYLYEIRGLIGKFPYTHRMNWCGEFSKHDSHHEKTLLTDLNFRGNEKRISELLGRSINLERIDRIILELASRQIKTIGDWISLRDYEPMRIPNLGMMALNTINAAIELYGVDRNNSD